MPTNKELFTSSMNNLNDTINSKAGTTGQHTIDQMITVANSIVTGKTEQTKYVTLDMSSGNQYISPDTNKTMSLVTVEKPSTLVASNIKKDVNIGGIVGTYEGSGGSAYAQISVPIGVQFNTTSAYDIQYIATNEYDEGDRWMDINGNIYTGDQVSWAFQKSRTSMTFVEGSGTLNSGSGRNTFVFGVFSKTATINDLPLLPLFEDDMMHEVSAQIKTNPSYTPSVWLFRPAYTITDQNILNYLDCPAILNKYSSGLMTTSITVSTLD